MPSPNFLCIGAQKSGTTLLYSLVRQINDIYLPSVKELHYFDDDIAYAQGLQWYQDTYFSESSHYIRRGEITPSYMYIQKSAERIYNDLGKDVKFIVILRNPIERAYSHYVMKYQTKEEIHSFNDALILESSRSKDKRFAYVKRGLYAEQIEHYFKFFDRKNFLFLEFDYFTENQDASMKEICDFLGVEKKVAFKNKTVHNSKLTLKERFEFSLLNSNFNASLLLPKNGYPDMSASHKKVLQECFVKDIEKLKDITGKDFSSWLQ